MLVTVALVAPGGTCNSTVASFPAHSNTRKISPFVSSAFLTAVSTTFSGATDAKECVAGSVPPCARRHFSRERIVVLVAMPLGHRILPRARMRIQRVFKMMVPHVRIGVGPLGRAQQRQPQQVAHRVVTILAVVDQLRTRAARRPGRPSASPAPRTAPSPTNYSASSPDRWCRTESRTLRTVPTPPAEMPPSAERATRASRTGCRHSLHRHPPTGCIVCTNFEFCHGGSSRESQAPRSSATQPNPRAQSSSAAHPACRDRYSTRHNPSACP